MSDKNLRRRLIVAAYQRPELRDKILPALTEETSGSKTAYSWLKNADAKGKDVQEFLKEEGDRKVKNPNPDSRDKNPEVKVKSLPNSDRGKGLFQKMFDKWKGTKDDGGSEEGGSDRAVKKLEKKFKKPSDKDKLTFWREVKKDSTRDELIDKDEVNKLWEEHKAKAVKLYVENPPKNAPKSPSMKDLALNYARKKSLKKSSKDEIRRELVKLAHERPELREKILPVLSKTAADSVPYGETEALLETLRGNAIEFTQYMRNLKDVATALSQLVKIAEQGRFDRSEKIDVSSIQFDGQVIMGKCKSGRGSDTYNTRISLLPKRGYNCTCPDRERRGGSVGPCKHVLALGREFWNGELLPEMEAIETAYSGVMSKLKLLPK
jgi:hypothetical protein